MHALQNIAESASTPLTKAPLPSNSPDDRFNGKMYAQEVLAKMVADTIGWKTLVHRLFHMTVESRKVAVDTIKKWKDMKAEELMDLHGWDKKKANKFLNSASTRASQINKIAAAINAGMSYNTLKDAWKCSDPEELSIEALYKTAQEFMGAQSTRGRKPDALLIKLHKWMEQQKKNQEPNAEDRKVMEELVSLYNRLAPQE